MRQLSADRPMQYTVGMYGGSFDPLHTGHIHDIIKAASMCDELYVVLCYNDKRDAVPVNIRYRWLLNTTRHLPNVQIIRLADGAESKEVYDTEKFWEIGARDIRTAIGKPMDAVFCGSDYLGTDRFESLYPECEVIYFDRAEVPISSTEIRSWAAAHWDYVPVICRSYYARKVLLVGGESTGKSTLAQNLALAYNTNYVAEIGRQTCDYAGGEELMIAEDMYENLLRQKVAVMDALSTCNRVVFVDTDAITTLFYSYFLLSDHEEQEKCRELAEALNAITDWDLVLFLEPTVAFVQDGTRNEKIAADRQKYSDQIKALLDANGVQYVCLGGSYYERFTRAKQLLADIGISTSRA